jgi:hypothetical protein
MICGECNEDHSDDDFLMKSLICYHCIYKRKIELSHFKEGKKACACKECNKSFIIDKTKKIRQRNVYCSKECAHTAHKKQMQDFWTNKVTCDYFVK